MTLGSDEYRTSMDALCSMYGVISRFPLDEMLATVERAETLGPILYPSEYRRATSLPQQRRILEAAQGVRKIVQEMGA